MLEMPPLETARLLIRPFVMEDLPAIHQLLDVELATAEFGSEGEKSLDERRRWLEWTTRNYDELAKLYQPPYGDRAIVLRQDGALVGACGYVQCLGPYGQLPTLRGTGPADEGFFSTEFGLFYAISPRHQRQGYATEAAAALLAHAFADLHMRRIIATTTYDNAGSIGVMRKIGMTVDRNPLPTPPWLQAVGSIGNPDLALQASA